MTLNECTVKKIQTQFFICAMHTKNTSCNEDHLEYTTVTYYLQYKFSHYLLILKVTRLNCAQTTTTLANNVTHKTTCTTYNTPGAACIFFLQTLHRSLLQIISCMYSDSIDHLGHTTNNYRNCNNHNKYHNKKYFPLLAIKEEREGESERVGKEEGRKKTNKKNISHH